MRIHCTNPEHQDADPSMEVYENGGYCFACGYLDRSVTDADAPKREPEDIGAKIEYIKSLPRVQVRGLTLPCDSQGYYILWPGEDYYKQRLTGELQTRYLGPAGTRPTLFKIPGDPSKVVAVVEGELNALSLSAGGYTGTIISPGSATNMINFLHDYLQLSYRFAIVVDRDAAGVAAGVELKKELIKRGKRVRLIAVAKDLNQVLQERGVDGIKEWIKENIDER